MGGCQKKTECKCNLFTHWAPKSWQELVQKCPCIPRSNWNLEMLVFRRGENRSTWRKTSWSRVENQQQTQPTHDGESGNQTQGTLVGGKRSHHYYLLTESEVITGKSQTKTLMKLDALLRVPRQSLNWEALGILQLSLNVLYLESCEIQSNRCAQAILPSIAFLGIE